MNRRSFISLFLFGLLLKCSPALATVKHKTKSRHQTKSRLKSRQHKSKSAQWISVGTVAELDKTGQIYKEKTHLGAILVIGTSKSKKLIAVNPTCTHLGCKVDWEIADKIFLCPCHASEFTTDGKVKNGPATKPLATYKTKIERNQVMVKRN